MPFLPPNQQRQQQRQSTEGQYDTQLIIECLLLAVASTQVQGWGDEPPNGVGYWRGTPLPTPAWGWANGGQPILVCYIRKYVIILGGYSRWRPPNQNINWGMCPRHPGRGWRQWLLVAVDMAGSDNAVYCTLLGCFTFSQTNVANTTNLLTKMPTSFYYHFSINKINWIQSNSKVLRVSHE